MTLDVMDDDGSVARDTPPVIKLGTPGLVFKRLTLLVGAAYFTFVAVTNFVDLVAVLGGYHWTVLDSGNAAYIESITKAYSVPHSFDHAAVALAAIAETIGAVLFWRAVVRYRGNGTGVRGVVGADVKRARVARLHRRHRSVRRLHLGEPVP